MAPDVDSRRLETIFFPYAESRTAAIKKEGWRFVYYTQAAVATSILKSRQIWLRNALVMNDFREIAHGFDCLNAAYEGAAGDVFKAALASCFADLPQLVEAKFNALLPSIRGETYLYCVSEHSASEDLSGRLSMWRAYGGSTGVAMVINGAVMHGASNVVGAYSSPVYYANAPEFAQAFMKVALGIQSEVAYLQSLGIEAVTNVVFQMMRYAVLCTKHPGFREEREWRVIASPTIHPGGRNESVVEVVRGVPQIVVKIDLRNEPDRGLTDLALPELLDRIIIGPCEFPLITALAFQNLLSEAGIPNPYERVVMADIPLRHDA